MPFPAGMEVAIYLQDAFLGSAIDTCACGTVANHHGDIRKFPASGP